MPVLIRNVLFYSFHAIGILCGLIGEMRIADGGTIRVYEGRTYMYAFLMAAGVMMILMLRQDGRKRNKTQDSKDKEQ